MTLVRNLVLAALLLEFFSRGTTVAETPQPVACVEVELEPATGQVIDAHLTKSTGDLKQDAAIIKQFRKWRFKRGRHVKVPILLANPKK
jgi:hypothetical protein